MQNSRPHAIRSNAIQITDLNNPREPLKSVLSGYNTILGGSDYKTNAPPGLLTKLALKRLDAANDGDNSDKLKTSRMSFKKSRLSKIDQPLSPNPLAQLLAKGNRNSGVNVFKKIAI